MNVRAELARRELARVDLARAAEVLGEPYYPWQRHLAGELMRASRDADAGAVVFVLVEAPAGHGKTRVVGEHWVTWEALRRVGARCMIATASRDLAEHTADVARQNARVWRDLVFPERRLGDVQQLGADHLKWTAAQWHLDGGGYVLTGAVGSRNLLGRRAGRILVDDPFGSWLDAQSGRERARVWGFFRGTLLTRIQSGTVVVVMHQRLHPDDPAGRLRAWCETHGFDLRVLTYRALAEEDDPLGRAPGEPLCPEMVTMDALRVQMASPEVWASMYQQRPVANEGALIRRAYLAATYPEPPEVVLAQADRVVVAHDLAFRGDRDPCAAVVVACRGAYRDVVRVEQDHIDYPAQRDRVRDLHAWAARWARCPVESVVEDRANGEAVVADLRAEVPGLRTIGATTGKARRMAPHLHIMRAGQVRGPEDDPGWWTDAVDRLVLVRGEGDEDDHIFDALAHALTAADDGADVSAAWAVQARRWA